MKQSLGLPKFTNLYFRFVHVFGDAIVFVYFLYWQKIKFGKKKRKQKTYEPRYIGSSLFSTASSRYVKARGIMEVPPTPHNNWPIKMGHALPSWEPDASISSLVHFV